MIRFLLKGLLRDRNRSLMPILVVAIGVMLTVVFHSWLTGVMGDSIEFNARFTAGHVKVTTAAYAENANQAPNDLALLGIDTLMQRLNTDYPQLEWVDRIHFGGLIDVPDSTGETRSQGTVMGFGIDLFSTGSKEPERMNLTSALKQGRLPQHPGEVLLSEEMASKMKINPGDTLSLIGATMNGEMAIYNFVLSGTVAFGSIALDKGSIVADISDVRRALDMEDAAGEVLGFFREGYYDPEQAGALAVAFNKRYHKPDDEFSPVMTDLRNQSGMGMMVDYSTNLLGIMIAVFLTAMSIVLWNTGLLGGLRRYGEFGMRLAIGESKRHVYSTLLLESLLIGLIGSVAGVAVGMGIAFYLQTHGFDMGSMMKNTTIMMPSIMRAHITPATWFIGFVPGVFSKLIGSMLSGIGIFKRQTAQLFKELET
jgi:putative ABC transport system permease protein